MDPLSIATSATALATFAFRASKAIYAGVENVKNADATLLQYVPLSAVVRSWSPTSSLSKLEYDIDIFFLLLVFFEADWGIEGTQRSVAF